MEKLISKVLKYFTNIVPINETYFVSDTIPNIKLTKEMIKINYGMLSPYKNGDVIFFSDKKYVYIWFTRNKLTTKKISIAEGLILFNMFNTADEAIIILEKGNSCGIAVVKDKRLMTQIFKKEAQPNEKFIELLTKEYSLRNPKVITVKNSEAFRLNLKDILSSLNSFNFDMKTFINNIYEQAKMPIIILLIILNFGNFFTSVYLDRTLKAKQNTLEKIKESNKGIKKEFDLMDKENLFWNDFKTREFGYPNLHKLLSVITESIMKNNSQINIIRQSSDSINMWVVSDSIPLIVQNLVSTGYFKSISVIRISHDNNDKSKEVGDLQLRLKKGSN